MGIAVSVLLIAAGAVLVWGIDATAGGVDLGVVGWICMGVGALGLVLTLVTASSARGGARERRETVGS